jgi:hypothetical protein
MFPWRWDLAGSLKLASTVVPDTRGAPDIVGWMLKKLYHIEA